MGTGGRVTVQQAGNRIGRRLTGHRVRELRLQEREKVLVGDRTKSWIDRQDILPRLRKG